MTLHEYMERHNLTLPRSRADQWRTLPYEQQFPARLRGQDHIGTIVPRITDGVHVYADRLCDSSAFLCHTTNVVYMRPDNRIPPPTPDEKAKAQRGRVETPVSLSLAESQARLIAARLWGCEV